MIAFALVLFLLLCNAVNSLGRNNQMFTECFAVEILVTGNGTTGKNLGPLAGSTVLSYRTKPKEILRANEGILNEI